MDKVSQDDLSAKLDKANAASKQRIAALATVGSFGGSFGGLDNSVSQAFTKAGQGIDEANDFPQGRHGGVRHRAERQPDPVHLQSGSVVRIVQRPALQFGTQGLGKMLANSMRT